MHIKLIIFFLLCANVVLGQGNGLYKFEANNRKYGFMDKNGNIKIKPKYLIVKDFSDGLCFVSEETIKKGYKWICIDTSGKVSFDIKDNFPETDFSEGFARVSSFIEHWFINKKGEKVFNKTWKDGQGNFKNGVAYVSDIEFQDFYPINTNGNRIKKVVYSRLEVNSKLAVAVLPSTDTMIKFKKDSLWGFKNSKGEVVIKPQYYFVDKFENGVCAVRINYQSFEIANDYYLDAIINTKGEVLSRVPMHCFLGFQGDLIVYYGGFHFSGGVHYIDKNGQSIIPH